MPAFIPPGIKPEEASSIVEAHAKEMAKMARSAAGYKPPVKFTPPAGTASISSILTGHLKKKEDELWGSSNFFKKG